VPLMTYPFLNEPELVPRLHGAEETAVAAALALDGAGARIDEEDVILDPGRSAATCVEECAPILRPLP